MSGEPVGRGATAAETAEGGRVEPESRKAATAATSGGEREVRGSRSGAHYYLRSWLTRFPRESIV